MNKPIKIDNLNDIEIEMLDQIWSFPDKESAEAWMRELPENEAMLAVSLITLLQLEIIDTDNPFTTKASLKEINKYLKKFNK